MREGRIFAQLRFKTPSNISKFFNALSAKLKIPVINVNNHNIPFNLRFTKMQKCHFMFINLYNLYTHIENIHIIELC